MNPSVSSHVTTLLVDLVAERWDLLMILIIIYYALYIPFYFGISGGYLNDTSRAWFAFNMVANICFIGMSDALNRILIFALLLEDSSSENISSSIHTA